MREIDYKEVLTKKLGRLSVDDETRRAIAAELDRYGLEAYERETHRVRLAILKLGGASLERVKEWTDIAKTDYRDALAAAEYPAELRTPTWERSESENRAVREKDSRQFQDWLDEDKG